MSAPLADLHVKSLLEMGIKLILSDPDHYLQDIFCEYTSGANNPLFGQQSIDQVKKWITTTKIPVLRGFDLTEAQLPAVTVNLGSSSPSQGYIGDESLPGSVPLKWQEKEVVVPMFYPQSTTLSQDGQSILMTLPVDMPFDQQQLVLPGLILRDAQGQEYSIQYDKDYNILIVQKDSESPYLSSIDVSRFEVLSPIIDARYSRGAKLYSEQIVVTVHGHSTRNEGYYLSIIVQWILLKFRPVLDAAYGLMLSEPVASDYSKDDVFQGEQVWRRYITVNTQSLWTWEAARQKDILALLLLVQASGSGSASAPVPLTDKPIPLTPEPVRPTPKN